MRKHETDGVDSATSQAWVRFQARLGDRLVELEEDDTLLVEDISTGGDNASGSLPYVQFCAWGEDMLRAEVSSNHVLMPTRALDARGELELVKLGYDAPMSPDDEGTINFYTDVSRSEGDRVAVMAVRALRDVFGVLHPDFLHVDGLPGQPVPPVEEAAHARGEEPLAVIPRGGPEQLRSLVDQALVPYLGHVPERDEDGDIPVAVGDTVVFIRVQESAPMVELFACVAADVQDQERAAFEVGMLNRDVQLVKFRLVEDYVMASMHLPAWPFAPEHLRAMLAVMSSAVESAEKDLGVRLHMQHATDTSEESPADDATADRDTAAGGPDGVSQHAAMILLQLDAEASGSVDPALVASICGHDVGLILRLIEGDSRQEIAWRQSRDRALESGDAEGAEVCDHEMQHARLTVSLLRRALRVVVERAASRDDEQPVENRRGPRPKRPGRRRVPDPTLEEVDPEIWG